MPFQFRKEAIEEDLNSNFPSQGQGNPPLYYSLSEVVVPTYSINQAAEGSSLPEMLQTAWDFSTGLAEANGNNTTTAITNPGFWLFNLFVEIDYGTVGTNEGIVAIDNGITSKPIVQITDRLNNTGNQIGFVEEKHIVFLKSGESLKLISNSAMAMCITYRQIATVNGTLVNPLGYSAA